MFGGKAAFRAGRRAGFRHEHRYSVERAFIQDAMCRPVPRFIN
jgi:hypothetical protein